MRRKQTTMDGNCAAAHVAYAFTEVAAVYPITPSSGMAEYMQTFASKGQYNLFGTPVSITEMQSEAGAAGAIHGALTAGALGTTFTASQGLLLMLPNLYRMAGELLPGVIHVAARTIATHALSIFGDHSDIYACRQTGTAILSTCSVQEVMDLAPIAHLAAIRGRVPFLHFFDGFRTSHEMQKIDVWDMNTLGDLLDQAALHAFRKRALHPDHGKIMGSAQNPDTFFQNREACNVYYQQLPSIVEQEMQRINALIGTHYQLFEYVGTPEAAHVVIAMGSVCETIQQTICYLPEDKQKQYGLIKVRLYRPFSAKHLIAALPENVQQITVLDRTKEPGSVGEPLYLDVTTALHESRFRDVPVFSCRYGLSSKDTTPSQILALLQNQEKRHCTIGIHDDVTHLSLDIKTAIDPLPKDCYCCKFWGLGGDGTVSANKSSIRIIGDNTNLHVQAYFEYDSKKSRGLTISHLRFGKSPIHAPYLIEKADFVACHNPVYLHKFDMVQQIKNGGIFLLNCGWNESDLDVLLPGQVRRFLAEHQIRLYLIDAMQIGKEIGLNQKISTILQAAFFQITGVLPAQQAAKLMKEQAKRSYGKKGEQIVQMNMDAIERGMRDVREVKYPESWRSAGNTPLDIKLLPDRKEVLDFVEHLQKPITRQKGDSLPVSVFLPYADGAFPAGTTAHERRNVATEIPVWLPENCIQCGRCAYVCPHAVIRPIILSPKERDNAPEGMHCLPLLGMPPEQPYFFSIAVSEVDCTGCGSCAGICPGKQGEKALKMTPIHKKEERQQYFDYGKQLPPKPQVFQKFRSNTIRSSQFRQPLLEFHGACAGCGETPYARLATQLFGTRMYIANATGCSSIWGHSMPSASYTVTADGKGPAWSNSLFEDGAEFGLGMLLAQQTRRLHVKKAAQSLVQTLRNSQLLPQLLTACQAWLDAYDDGEGSVMASTALYQALCQAHSDKSADISSELTDQISVLFAGREHFVKKSHWVFGGDGFAYDIGFGGLDHVLASGADINVLIFDTEVYSNTGGQASKATPYGAAAKLLSGRKHRPKKDLAGMFLTYGNVYVAQIAMGADLVQTLNAMQEAERYHGPSILIAYAPCISHGIKAGMGSSQHEQAKAVKSGHWQLFRYDPERTQQGENPFLLDSKAPELDYAEFLAGEARFAAPSGDALEETQATQYAAERYAKLCRYRDLFVPRSE